MIVPWAKCQISGWKNVKKKKYLSKKRSICTLRWTNKTGTKMTMSYKSKFEITLASDSNPMALSQIG
jgi:hypothetical protein